MLVPVPKQRECVQGRKIMALFGLRNTVYVRIRSDWLSVLQVESGTAYADVPILAVANKGGKHAYPETLK